MILGDVDGTHSVRLWSARTHTQTQTRHRHRHTLYITFSSETFILQTYITAVGARCGCLAVLRVIGGEHGVARVAPQRPGRQVELQHVLELRLLVQEVRQGLVEREVLLLHEVVLDALIGIVRDVGDREKAGGALTEPDQEGAELLHR